MLARAVHPGEILEGELDEIGITASELARQIEVPANRLSQIIDGRRAVTGDTALRLGHWFAMDPQFWMNLQSQYDLALAAGRVGAAVRALPTMQPDRTPRECRRRA